VSVASVEAVAVPPVPPVVPVVPASVDVLAVLESVGDAEAIPPGDAITIPTPRATAKAPTRPT
jgi:hypothetical protein